MTDHMKTAIEAGNEVAKPYRHPENTRNIIEAALPHLRAMIAQEILSGTNTFIVPPPPSAITTSNPGTQPHELTPPVSRKDHNNEPNTVPKIVT